MVDGLGQDGLSAEELGAEGATALPDKEVVSILDLNADINLAIDAAAPIDLAVAANANVAAPIDAAVGANVLSVDSTAQALSDQGVIIDQGLDADATAHADQGSAIAQSNDVVDASAPAEGAQTAPAAATLDTPTDPAAPAGGAVGDVVGRATDAAGGVTGGATDPVSGALDGASGAADGTTGGVGAGALAATCSTSTSTWTRTPTSRHRSTARWQPTPTWPHRSTPRSEIAAFGKNIASVPLSEIRDRLTAYETRILDIVESDPHGPDRTGVVPSRPTPASTLTPDPIRPPLRRAPTPPRHLPTRCQRRSRPPARETAGEWS